MLLPRKSLFPFPALLGTIFTMTVFTATVFTATAQEEVAKIQYAKVRDTSVTVESVFGKAARHGALPFRITIRNNSGEDRLWTVSLGARGSYRKLNHKSTFQFAVKNGTEIREDVIFFYSPSFLSSSYRNISVSITSPGLEPLRRSSGDRTNQDFPKLALSKPLAQRSLAKLNDLVKKQNSSNYYFGHSFETGYLPTNWIGYSGLDALLLDENALNAVSAAQLQAIRSWVRLGGVLDIFVTDPTNVSSLPKEIASELGDSQSVDLSRGRITVREWDGVELPQNLIAPRGEFRRNIQARESVIENDFYSNWGLQKQFGTKTFNPIFVFILLLLFAVIVAPVNLFFLAKKGRRHRLFITTPVISLAACLILIAAIFLMDGIGGRGLRTVFVDLQPTRSEMRSYTTQEQISRTGVIINPGFEAEIPYDITPVNIPDSVYNPFSGGGNQSTTFEIAGTDYKGGFFRSRSEQGYLLRSTSPTRARIELAGNKGGKPVLVSSIDSALTSFFYIDNAGEVWTTPDKATVSPGGTVTLKKSDPEQLKEWLTETMDLFHYTLRSDIKAMSSGSNRFFATVAEPDQWALPTHSRINWEETRVLLSGTPLVKKAANKAEPNPTAE